jgi:hypothetical protein
MNTEHGRHVEQLQIAVFRKQINAFIWNQLAFRQVAVYLPTSGMSSACMTKAVFAQSVA